MAALQRESEMQKASAGDTPATRAEGVPHNQEPHTYICTRTPAVPLSVKPLSQCGARNARRSVNPVTAEPGIKPLPARSHQPLREEEEGRAENDTRALSSNPCGVICTSVSLIDDY